MVYIRTLATKTKIHLVHELPKYYTVLFGQSEVRNTYERYEQNADKAYVRAPNISFIENAAIISPYICTGWFENIHV